MVHLDQLPRNWLERPEEENAPNSIIAKKSTASGQDVQPSIADDTKTTYI
jgi:hypothetical protein